MQAPRQNVGETRRRVKTPAGEAAGTPTLRSRAGPPAPSGGSINIDALLHDVKDGDDLEAKGNIVDHEYTIERDGDDVAEVSKRWFRVRDTYGIEISPDVDPGLILAVTVCIDQMTHE